MRLSKAQREAMEEEIRANILAHFEVCEFYRRARQTTREIAYSSGHPTTTVRRVLDKMRREGWLRQMPALFRRSGGSLWERVTVATTI